MLQQDIYISNCVTPSAVDTGTLLSTHSYFHPPLQRHMYTIVYTLLLSSPLAETHVHYCLHTPTFIPPCRDTCTLLSTHSYFHPPLQRHRYTIVYTLLLSSPLAETQVHYCLHTPTFIPPCRDTCTLLSTHSYFHPPLQRHRYTIVYTLLLSSPLAETQVHFCLHTPTFIPLAEGGGRFCRAFRIKGWVANFLGLRGQGNQRSHFKILKWVCSRRKKS